MILLRRVLVLAFFLVALHACGGASSGDGEITNDLVILNGRVLDPESGLDEVRNIGIRDGVIDIITDRDLSGTLRIDAEGLVVSPGFIDLNTYQHGDPLFRLRAADGVTSVLNLEDGAADVEAYYSALAGRALINYGAAVDHETVRGLAAGDSTIRLTDGVNETRGIPEIDGRALTEAEIVRLEELTRRGLEQGAAAIGFGIAYVPGATHDEVLRLAEIAAEYEAPVHVHARSFDRTRDWDEVYEPLGLAVGGGASVHIKHLQSTFGRYTERALELIDRARAFGIPITSECYPYTAGLTFIDSALLDDFQSWPDDRFARFEWPPTGERLDRSSFERYRAVGGVVVIHAADEAGQELAVQECLSHPATMVASDGAWDDGQTHPRSAGTHSRVLGRYVRERGLISLMEAIRKMTLAPAEHLEARIPAMRRKGRLQAGMDADIVVFDPNTIVDRATYAEPLAQPNGIHSVIVAGVPVVSKGQIVSDVWPGQPLRGLVREAGAPDGP